MTSRNPTRPSTPVIDARYSRTLFLGESLTHRHPERPRGSGGAAVHRYRARIMQYNSIWGEGVACFLNSFYCMLRRQASRIFHVRGEKQFPPFSPLFSARVKNTAGKIYCTNFNSTPCFVVIIIHILLICFISL